MINSHSLQFDIIAHGLHLTLWISLWTMILSIPLGILLGVMRSSKFKYLKWPAKFYIELIKHIPFVLYVIMIFLTLSIEAELRGILTLTTFSSAYIAEIVRSRLMTLDRNQLRAATSLGMNKYQIFFNITIPQAFTKTIPALIKQFNVIIKDTSILSIGLLELTRSGKDLWVEYPNYSMGIIIVIAVIYFIICYGLSFFAKYLEKNYQKKFAEPSAENFMII